MYENRKVIITTEYRGVYFGELQEQTGREVVLKDARCAIYWATTRGINELAEVGPNKNSKIGARAPKIWLTGVTSVVDVTPEAVSAWEKYGAAK